MEFKVPLRIYWDLPPSREAACPPPEICDQVRALRVLALDLDCAGNALPPELWQVLQRVQGSGVALTVTAAAAALSGATAEELAALGVRALLLRVLSLDELRALPAATWGRGAGVSFPVTERSVPELPGVVAHCVEQGIKRLVFPIQRALEEPPFHLGADRGRALSAELRKIELPAGLQLTIHDPLLWKAFYPDRPFPEGGCQAANSMLYIAPDAAVYPCPVLPYRLGTLGAEPLAQIVASEKKRELRRILRESPAECGCCAEVEECLGGCRGKGYLQRADWQAADPSCR